MAPTPPSASFLFSLQTYVSMDYHRAFSHYFARDVIRSIHAVRALNLQRTPPASCHSHFYVQTCPRVSIMMRIELFIMCTHDMWPYIIGIRFKSTS